MNSCGKYCVQGGSGTRILLNLEVSGKGHSSQHSRSNVLNHAVHSFLLMGDFPVYVHGRHASSTDFSGSLRFLIF